MRFLPLALVGGLTLAIAGCGLDPNGLGEFSGAGDDGSTSGDDGPGPITSDGSGSGDDTTAPGDDTTTPSESGDDAGEDATVGDSGGEDGDGGGTDVSTHDANTNDVNANDANGADAGKDSSITDAGPDVTIADAGKDTGPADAGVDTGPADAGVDAADACVPNEICNNGIDDNCDGRLDCQDPECNPQWTCTGGAVPTGWTLVEFDETTRPSCSSGYSNSAFTIDDVTSQPATCNCTCGVTQPGSCESGSYSARGGTGGVFGCGLVSQSFPAGNGQCTKGQPYTPPPGSTVQIDPAPYAPGKCNSDAGTDVAPFTANRGRTCKETASTGGGCGTGSVCAPTPSVGSLCIVHDGNMACPSGFGTLYTVGDQVSDTRTCSGCSCTGTTATCANVALALYVDQGCNADAGTITLEVDGGCNPVPPTGGETFNAYVYTAQAQGESCGATTATPSGTATLKNQRTICCQ